MAEQTGPDRSAGPPPTSELAASLDRGGSDSVAEVELAQAGWGRSIATGGALLFLGNIVASVGFFVAVLLVARGLAPPARGTIAFITVTAQIVARLAGTGTPQATAVQAARRPSDRSVLLVNVFGYVGIVAALFALSACVGIWLLGDISPSGVGPLELLLLALGALAAACSEAGYSFLLGCSRFREQMAIQMTVPWVYAALLGAFYAGPGLTVARAALAWTAAMGSGAVLLALTCLRGVGLARPDLRLLVETMRFGLRAWIGSLCNVLNFRADQVLMGFIATEASLGVYAVAVNGAEVLLYLPAALGLALVPGIAGTDAARRAERALGVFRIVSLVTLPLIVVAALLGPTVLPAVFGSAYGDAVQPFLWLLPGTFGFVAISLLSNALMASGSPGIGSLPPLAALVTGIGFDLVLIPRYGATGAAVAATVGYAAGGVVALTAYRLHSPFSWRLVVPRSSDIRVLRRLAGRLLQPLSR